MGQRTVNYFVDALTDAGRLIIALDPEVYRIVWTSLKISITASLIVALVAVPTGILIALRDFYGKRLLQQTLNTLMAMPTVMIGLLLYGLLSRRGPLGDLGLLYTPAAMVLGESVLILPIVLNLTVAAVQSADPRLVTTLRALGADWKQELLWVLSETRFAVLAAIVVGFGRAIGEVGAAMMLGGNIQGLTRTMTTAIALETSKGEFELGLALGLLLLGIAFAVNIGLHWLQRDKP